MFYFLNIYKYHYYFYINYQNYYNNVLLNNLFIFNIITYF